MTGTIPTPINPGRQDGDPQAAPVSPPERHYAKPPLVEVLCELHFKGSKWEATVAGQFYDRVKERFPAKREDEQYRISFGSGSYSVRAEIGRLPPVIRFASEDGRRVLQIAPDLLVVNQLAPYPGFEAWEPDIFLAFRIFRELAQPAEVAWLALRYINQIIVPGPVGRIEEYFTMYPELPQTLGRDTRQFLLRVELASSSPEHRFFMALATCAVGEADQERFTLELHDVVENVNALDEERIRCLVRQAHANIVWAFESAITDRLREVFGVQD